MTRIRVLSAFLLLAAAILACDLPAMPGGAQPMDQAATGVAATLAALSSATAPVTPSATVPPAATPEPELLPRAVYYLAKDRAGLLQVFRLAKDGRTVQQITFEPSPVGTFDVSPVDGSVAYGTNNQLYWVDAGGAGRKLLADGGPVDENNRWVNNVGSPAWSPDGKTIAFTNGGLSFYTVASGEVKKALENQFDTSPGFPIVKEIYSPNAYSPDGSLLLISIGFYEAGSYGIYRPSDNTLTRFTWPGSMMLGEVRWVPDGTGLYIASPVLGMFESGLAYVDAATGVVHTLLPGSAPDGTYNFAAAPQVGPDGKLYFFFNNLTQIPVEGHTPLYLVRSATDGVTDRTRLKPDPFQNVNEILWAPDASMALVASVAASAATPGVFEGGQVQLVYPDDRAGVVIIPFGQQLRWGP